MIGKKLNKNEIEKIIELYNNGEVYSALNHKHIVT